MLHAEIVGDEKCDCDPKRPGADARARGACGRHLEVPLPARRAAVPSGEEFLRGPADVATASVGQVAVQPSTEAMFTVCIGAARLTHTVYAER